MEDSVVIDADVFIRHWRTKSNRETLFEQLNKQYRNLFVSAVAKYEVFVGVAEKDRDEWEMLFNRVIVLAFDDATIETARGVFRQLKRENKMIVISDILIASTAMVNDLPLATLNRDHFERIRGLRLVG